MPPPPSHDSSLSDPHAGGPLLTAGPPPAQAAATVVLVHGRGATAEGMLSLYDALGIATLAAVAPQAAGNTWYPRRFIEPIETNQPSLDSALRRLGAVVDDLRSQGVASDRVALLGFSQGACLVAEFVARNPRRYGAVLVLSGGLIGAPGTPRDYPGSLDGTPVFIGAAEPDAHIPYERAVETKAVLDRMGASVELRRYADAPHSVNADELAVCQQMLSRLAGRPSGAM